MKIAYLILAHNNLEHLKRLVKALNDDGIDFFIHLDKKVSTSISFDKESKINLVKNRIDIKWGGYSMVEATFMLLKTAYETGKYDYYVLLSGVDYPIKSNQYIKSFFMKNNGKSFINVVKMPGNGKGFDRLEYYHLEGGYRQTNKIMMICIRSINRLIQYLHIKRKLPKMYSRYVPYGGSSWWAFHTDFVDYLMKYYHFKAPKAIIFVQ